MTGDWYIFYPPVAAACFVLLDWIVDINEIISERWYLILPLCAYFKYIVIIFLTFSQVLIFDVLLLFISNFYLDIILESKIETVFSMKLWYELTSLALNRV